MSEVLIPPWIIPEEEQQEPLDEGSSVFSAAFAPGIAQRQSYGGMRLKLSRRHTVRAEEKAQLLSILRSTRGRYNALRSKVHFALRGSFPAVELLTNPTFANGTTGYSAGGEYSISVADRILRAARTSMSSSTLAVHHSSAVACTQYAPYVASWFTYQGRGSYPSGLRIGVGSTSNGSEYVTGSAFTAYGLQSLVAVPTSTTISSNLTDLSASGLLAGDYFSASFASISRCALVDNGINLLIRSDELDNTGAWSSVTSNGLSGVSANATTAPDGTVTAERLIENGSASSHFRAQSVTIASAAAEYSFSIALAPSGRSWVALSMVEATGSGEIIAWFNISTGVVGTTNAGTNWSNVRAFITNLGGTYYRCTIVGRKTNAATSLGCRVYLANGDGSASYTGDGTSAVYAWRATLAQSSVPTRLAQTTTTATTGTSQTGSAIQVKGLPVSTNALLLPEDVFEINGELKTCTAALNSDAAGLGYLQFEPALVRSPADNDPVIILNPMGKFLMSNLKIDNEFGTQAKASYDLEHIYE